MSPDVIQRLVEVGLTDKEARMYAAMLELGPQGAQEIAERADIPRATAYTLLESLSERGLVSTYEEGKRTVYVAETPKRLVDLVEQEARSLHEKKEKLVFFVPELEALFRTQRNKPVVRFYEGEEGLRSLRDHLARQETRQYDSFIRLDAALARVASEDESRRHAVSRTETRYRVLYVADAGVETPSLPQMERDRMQVRYARDIPFSFQGEAGVLDGMAYVVVTAPRVMACVMESAELAMLLRAQFELAWRTSSETRVDI